MSTLLKISFWITTEEEFELGLPNYTWLLCSINARRVTMAYFPIAQVNFCEFGFWTITRKVFNLVLLNCIWLYHRVNENCCWWFQSGPALLCIIIIKPGRTETTFKNVHSPCGLCSYMRTRILHCTWMTVTLFPMP